MNKTAAFLLSALFFAAGSICGGGLCYRLEVEPVNAKLDNLERIHVEEMGRLSARIHELETRAR